MKTPKLYAIVAHIGNHYEFILDSDGNPIVSRTRKKMLEYRSGEVGGTDIEKEWKVVTFVPLNSRTKI